MSPWTLPKQACTSHRVTQVNRAGKPEGTEARQPPAPVPGEASGATATPGPEPDPLTLIPATSTPDPHRTLTQGLRGGRRDGPAGSTVRGGQRRPVPAAEHRPVPRMQRRRRKRPGRRRKRSLQPLLRHLAAAFRGARPLAVRRDACAGRLRAQGGRSRGLREGRVRGGRDRHSPPPTPGPGGGRKRHDSAAGLLSMITSRL